MLFGGSDVNDFHENHLTKVQPHNMQLRNIGMEKSTDCPANPTVWRAIPDLPITFPRV